jgi:thiamine biosynthesis lipoprotein
LGTVVEITVSADAATVDTQAAVNAAFAQIEWIQRLMSYHEPESDVSRLNRHAVRKVTQVDDQTYLVLSWALELFRQSSGAFDIAIASLLTRWGYLPADQGPTCPSSCRETSAAIELLPENSVRFLRPLAIDLGGIAKGYAVDRAVETLQAQGVTQGLVNAGGDLRAFGPKPEPVAVRNPMQPKSFIPLPDLSEAALATSAHYFSAKPWQGRVVTPLVNPLTDEPCALQRSVSVRAPS